MRAKTVRMFPITFQTTLKSLFRSPTFYMAVLLLSVVSIYEAIRGGYSYFSPVLMEMIEDTDPRFAVSRSLFLQNINNACCAEVMMYAMPLFTVISTAVILGHNYSDRFYEIEKAGNVKSSTYLFGRLSALLAVNLVAVIVACLVNHLLYIFTRGGVDGMSTMQIIFESTWRILRWVAVMLLPGILFYMSFTYVIGTVLKSGGAGAVGGMAHIVFYYVVNLILRHRIAPVYFDYLSPIPRKLRHYLYAFEQEAMPVEQNLIQRDTSLGKALICLGVIVGVSVIYVGITYWRQRRRVA